MKKVLKILLIVFVGIPMLIGLFKSITEEPSEKNTDIDKSSINSSNSQTKKEDVKQLSKNGIEHLRQIQSLYNELMAFKGKSDFIAKGFGRGGEYNNWLNEVTKLKNKKTEDMEMMRHCGFVTGDLEMLGMEYISIKGKESDYTSFTREAFEQAFNDNLN